MIKPLFGIFFFLAFFAIGLFFVQEWMIYAPYTHYTPAVIESVRGKVEFLTYATGQGRQTAFYVPPRQAAAKQDGSSAPQHLWLLFSGNGGAALGWLPFVEAYPDNQTGFLLVEYPGYGMCEGKTSPEAVQVSSSYAFKELAQHLNRQPGDLARSTSVFGQSLGTGAALLFAAVYPINKVILVSPFTSMLDMACRRVGKPFCYLLRHNYDNDLILRQLVTAHSPPRVYIYHGAEDRYVPVEMGRQLAQISPANITYQEVAGADHGTALSMAEKDVYTAMME
jgi:uncharacterized protein